MLNRIRVRKAHTGTDSAGHTWPTDGAVIEVPVEHALVLARIPDGGFTIIEHAETPEPVEAAEKTPKAATVRTPRAKTDDPALAT
ncbi:hypothetical protein [Catenulispora pinistramenti]|uniref:hypothetical protein n=1 Tax=Catenulispora pinistramenti TaxID=2705254 RepID=UPI001E5DE4A6|nr:hypothetical protein [Catenulispora pinistramenti]